ncbi:N-acetyl sugar amidotransferase [Azospirillum thermophilum]|uniref:N-acetyl sugar amidotransferase n=1 Tax=Azospirillum thermophilum TaxID=2202148 RepID=A0A2S2D1E5_9PROT|nr:N-acetyl sugar amidotransferase [Azospirillum thermophilum]AWK90257.1 N-acetyl sugar amidotransferase [Azospirillum thermophilum]
MQTILDRQFNDLPDDVAFCRNCVVSNQRPRTLFNEHGVCSACQWSYEKDNVIDWESREQELERLCDQHRSRDGSFDVVVPGSGGKDTAFVAHQLKHKYGMHPLCVTWTPFEWTDIGWQNFRAWNNAGFDIILGQPNGQLHRKLARLAFELKGDAWEPFAYGQKAWAFHMAARFGIKLIMYGENGELEYGGSTKYKHKPKEGPEEWTHEYYKGSSVDDLIRAGRDRGLLSREEEMQETVRWYKAPHPDVIAAQGIEMHWFSYYRKWIPQENWYYAARHCGFRANPKGRSEGTYTKYASLDDKADGFHWYLSYMKFGMGRCSRDVQTDIRRHHLTRDEGIALVRRYDGEFPAEHYDWFLDYLGIDDGFFWQVMDSYRRVSKVWTQADGEWRLTHVVS